MQYGQQFYYNIPTVLLTQQITIAINSVNNIYYFNIYHAENIKIAQQNTQIKTTNGDDD